MPGEMRIVNMRQAGQLFIKLALGIEEGEQIPTCTRDAKRLLIEEGGIDVESYDTVIFHQDTPDTLHLVVRRKDLIENALGSFDDLSTRVGPGSYEFTHPSVASSYDRFFTGEGDDRPTALQFLQTRIGDYTLGSCM